MTELNERRRRVLRDSAARSLRGDALIVGGVMMLLIRHAHEGSITFSGWLNVIGSITMIGAAA